jgi:hypothetical protein
MEFWRFDSCSFCCSFVGDISGTDSFDNNAFFCFRFAAWDSTRTSSVGSDSELDDDVSVESGEGFLFRFTPEAAGDGFEVDGDITQAVRYSPVPVRSSISPLVNRYFRITQECRTQSLAKSEFESPL